MNKLEGKINEKTARTIAEASLDPAVMANLLEKAAAQAARTEQIGNKIRAKKMTGGKAFTERAQNITNALRRGGQISNALALQEAQ
jgi:hydroxylamine reductase (hybrid-cluster protein)